LLGRSVLTGVCIIALPILILSASTPNSVKSSQDPWKAPSWADTLENTFPEEPLTLPLGEELYYLYCKSCHGETGYGNGPLADTLNIKPTNFNDKNFISQSDGAIFWKLTQGRGSMPSFKEKFSEEQRWLAIVYLRKLAEYNAGLKDTIKNKMNMPLFTKGTKVHEVPIKILSETLCFLCLCGNLAILNITNELVNQ